MTKNEWIVRVNAMAGDIASDKDLSDEDFIEVLEELESVAQISIEAKKSEMEREETS